MRPLVLFLATIGLAVSVAQGQQMTTADARAIPNITLRYSDLLDVPCYTMLQRPVDSGTVRMVMDSMPAILARWREDAPVLFAAAQRLTNIPFGFRESQAAVITCPGLVSMSVPLIINVGLIAHGPNAEGRPLSERVSRALFHEVLHRYVYDRLQELGRNTPALRKYANEPPVVRSHLYNVAIMEEVYRMLGRTSDLAATTNTNGLGNSAIPGVRNAGDMRRALEIIAAEGAATLVREISNPPVRP